MEAKAIQKDLESYDFSPSLAKSEIRKEVGRRRARSKDERMKCVSVTRKGGREASEKISGLGEVKRQLEIARQAAR